MLESRLSSHLAAVPVTVFVTVLVMGVALAACSGSETVDDAAVEEVEATVDAAPPEPLVCPPMAPAPDLLPGVTAEHETLAYWLERMGEVHDLDEVLLTPGGIVDHNAALLAQGHGQTDLLAPIELDALETEIRERIDWVVERVDDGRYVDAAGDALAADVVATMRRIEPLQPTPRYHRVTGDVPVRCVPWRGSFFTPSLDLRFDRNNCSTLREGEVVQVVQRWGDGWLVRSRYTMGWVEGTPAFSPALDREEAVALLTDPFGTTSPTGLTRRAVLERAFAHVGQPYGWGGQDGGLDCSRFVMDLFAEFGLQLPRFSGHQATAGTFSIDLSEVESETERMLLVDAAARRGVVLLHFPGHVMLYLGRDEDGRPMALHSFAEYVAPCSPEDQAESGRTETLFTVDRVLVSDLELGRGASRTAFVERLTRATVLGHPAEVGLMGVAEHRPGAPVDPASCPEVESVATYVSPRRPHPGRPMRIIMVGHEDPGPVDFAVYDPDGQRVEVEMQAFGGPPWSRVATVEAPRAGTWQATFGDGDRVLGCGTFDVGSGPQPLGASADGPVWELRNAWGPDLEALYATWVEALFDYPLEDDRTWTNLHSILQDPHRNLLYDYYSRGEEEDLRLQPDCADLPYFLRAYFAWKVGAPFGFRQCSRGRAGRPPTCANLVTNLSERDTADPVEAFERFANRGVRNSVHSASGRTHPDDNETDWYPVPLDRASLTPGTMYADPYGHLLVLSRWVPQGATDYGVLMASDAQPDGTVGRRRFWRGSFLFTPETTDVGAGFKAFRPLVLDAETGELRSMTNDELADDPRYVRHSYDQYEVTQDGFYDAVEALINPRPLDAWAMQIALVDAFEESVARRLNSVNNGEEFMAGRGWSPIDMPTGAAIFQTSGPWEDFSTPSRDMRLLISLDTVVGFPEVVRRAPERFGVRAGEADAAADDIATRLRAELEAREFTYTRSDGTPWTLSLADLTDRAVAMEMAYNPNDCVEHRWGAPEGSEERGPCDRYAPTAQVNRMREYRPWFENRRRPSR